MSLRLEIGDAIIDALSAIDGATARWLHDDTGNELTASNTLLCVLVMGDDNVTVNTVRPVQRELSGHIIVESHADTVGALTRAAWFEEVAKVEAALFGLANDIAIVGVTEFSVAGVSFTWDFVPDGTGTRLGARINWTCSYRHDSANPREYTGL